MILKQLSPESYDKMDSSVEMCRSTPHLGAGDMKKTFRCPQCKYVTDRKNNLNRHIITMHQESSKSLQCCGLVFKSKAALRDHVCLFHRGGYCCHICGRNFCRKALLHRHHTVHSGQKDFSCHLCGYATSHKSNLERHQKVHYRCQESWQSNRDMMLGTSNQYNISNQDSKIANGAARRLSKCYLPNRLTETYINTKEDNSLNTPPNCGQGATEMEICSSFSSFEDSNSPVQETEWEKNALSNNRLIRHPYKCNICRRCFSHQKHLFGHKCLSIRHRCQPTLSIVNAVRKGKIQTNLIKKRNQKLDEGNCFPKISGSEQQFTCSGGRNNASNDVLNMSSRDKSFSSESLTQTTSTQALTQTKNSCSLILCSSHGKSCQEYDSHCNFPSQHVLTGTKRQQCNLSEDGFARREAITCLVPSPSHHVHARGNVSDLKCSTASAAREQTSSAEVKSLREKLSPRLNDVTTKANHSSVSSPFFHQGTFDKPPEKKINIWRVW